MNLSWTSPALSLLSWSHAASQCSTLIYQTFQQKLKPFGGISRNMRLHNVSRYRQTYHQFPEVPVSGSRNTAQTWWWSPDNDLWWLWSSGTEMKLLPSQTSETHFRNHGDGWKTLSGHSTIFSQSSSFYFSLHEAVVSYHFIHLSTPPNTWIVLYFISCTAFYVLHFLITYII